MLELTISRAFDGLHSAGSGNGITVTERTGLGIANVIVRRGKASDLAGAVRQRYGVELADAPVLSKSGQICFIGTGSGRWLALTEKLSATFIEDLQHDLDDLASVIDQSHAFGVLRLTGPAVPSVLEKGVQIDLAPDAFETGRAATTQIAHVGVILWKVDDTPTFDVAVARSLAGSFSHWLEASSAIHGLTVNR